MKSDTRVKQLLTFVTCVLSSNSCVDQQLGTLFKQSATDPFLFVSGIVAFTQDDFATAVDNVKQSGVELILGSEAKELLCKLE